MRSTPRARSLFGRQSWSVFLASVTQTMANWGPEKQMEIPRADPGLGLQRIVVAESVFQPLPHTRNLKRQSGGSGYGEGRAATSPLPSKFGPHQPPTQHSVAISRHGSLGLG